MKQLLALCACAAVLAGAGPARAEISACADAAERGHLNVLTINILYTNFFTRLERLRAVADLIEAEAASDEPVDIILLQEVVSGALAGSLSMSLRLELMLGERGLAYNLRFRPVAGLPGLFMVGNAMLSRCAVTGFASRLLPYAGEAPFGGPGFPVLHEAQAIDIEVPGYGQASVCNTHLCAYCTGADRLRQTEALLRFLDRRDDGAARLIVLGGDFNTDLTVAADLPAYRRITDDSGFNDSYAEAHSCSDCCSETEGLAGCTWAVPGNAMAEGAAPVRIDYIFARGDVRDFESQVVFNEQPWVSDHSGVLTRINLAP